MFSSLTSEQKGIVKSSKDYNIIVDSVPGSGKTTTILSIALEYPNDKILCVMYNRKLCDETIKKKKKMKLDNIYIFTCHGVVSQFYIKEKGEPCSDDKRLKEGLKILEKQEFDFDRIIVDECQDMTPLFFEMLKIIIKRNKIGVRLCLIGDKHQCIYGYNGSDIRFLTKGDELLKFFKSPYEWKRLNLSISFRLSQKHCDFVNKCVLNEDRIISYETIELKDEKIEDGDEDEIKYIITNLFESKHVCKKIIEFKEKYRYENEDILILAKSIRNRGVKNVVNILSKKYDMYVPSNDDEAPDPTFIYKKITVLSFHQAKGIERKLVIVLGFDDSLTFHGENIDECSNALYVAITRSRERMILVHHFKNDYLPFFKKNTSLYSLETEQTLLVEKEYSRSESSRSVTNLIRHVSNEIIEKCMECIECDCVQEKSERIFLKRKTKGKTQGTFESVSTINGVFMPLKYEYKITKRIQSIEMVKSVYTDYKDLTIMPFVKIIENFIEKNNAKWRKLLINYEENKLENSDILFFATIIHAMNSGYTHQLNQIKYYNWLYDKDIEKCILSMKELNLDSNIKIETPICYNGLRGIVDCLDTKNHIVYELKCTQDIKDIYKIQLALYLYLYMEKGENYTGVLYNILTREKYEIKLKTEMVDKFYKLILNKEEKNKKSDEEFVKEYKIK